jgi:ribose transport system ATP-binding protein
MLHISKSFPGVQALKDVSFVAFAGEVHALMGENGAGKSTLMKILAGAYTADSGEIRVFGQPVRIHNPLDARRAGINLIYQELNLARNLTVAENLFMGAEPSHGGLIDRKSMYAGAREVLQQLGASFTPDTPLARLSIAEGQLVEIARALLFKGRVLVMDEPTAALSERETEHLFRLIHRLRSQGIAIVYISHRMAEVYTLADRLTVLRDGQRIGTLEKAEIDAERVVQMMVGRPVQDFYQHRTARDQGEVVLEIRGVTDGARVLPSSFSVRAGEILGLAGLVGAGRTELARLIFGADRKTGGEVWVKGQRVSIRTPADALAAGIGYVPENRKEQGLFLEMASGDNIAMNVLDKYALAGVLNPVSIAQMVRRAIQDLAIRVPSPTTRAKSLSGGNQQKLLLARWLAIGPKVLLLDEPTRGVDVGAKAEIYRLIGELAAQGVAVVFISSELPEIVGMSDRVLVMREGRIVGELDPARGDIISQENIMTYATGVRVMEVQP